MYQIGLRSLILLSNSLLALESGGVRVSNVSSVMASFKEHWVSVSLDDGYFLLKDKFHNPCAYCRDCVLDGSFKWYDIGSFISLMYDSETLKYLHLCLNVFRLDKKVGDKQLKGKMV